MLSEHESKLLCEVGPGTPMGELYRRFWMPVLLQEELPEPDGDPVALRILGEDLVAFRDTEGKVGLVAAYCAHRHANLFWGRNEGSGLRCTYHGWKYDAMGQCVDMPNEPEESRFKEKVHLTSYPTREAGGHVWAYFGPPALEPPDLPQLEWTLVPDENRIVTKRLQESNWAQAVEGGIDSSHVSFLHSTVDGAPRMVSNGAMEDSVQAGAVLNAVESSPRLQALAALDKSPRFFTLVSDFGMFVSARRNAPDDQFYWRVTPFLLPALTIIPGGGEDGRSISGHYWVPIDDGHTWTFSVTWNTEHAIDAEEQAVQAMGFGIHTQVDKAVNRWDLNTTNGYVPVRNTANSYQIDRAEQRGRTFTGIKGISEQDMSIQESMGRTVPRWLEHLGGADRGIIEFRRMMLDLIRDLQEGKEPDAPQHPDVYRVRSAAYLLGRGEDWETSAAQHCRSPLAEEQGTPGEHETREQGTRTAPGMRRLT